MIPIIPPFRVTFRVLDFSRRLPQSHLRVELKWNFPNEWKVMVVSQVSKHRLMAYLTAAGGISAVAASSAEGAVVGHTTPHTIGINQDVNIDFNLDGQIDFQIDHDRYSLEWQRA